MQNTDKQSQFFGQAPEVSIRLSENKILEIMSKTTYKFVTKYKILKYSVEDTILQILSKAKRFQVQKEPEKQKYVQVHIWDKSNSFKTSPEFSIKSVKFKCSPDKQPKCW